MYETANKIPAHTAVSNKIDEVMQLSAEAFGQYRKIAPLQRAAFLDTVAVEIEKERATLVQTAVQETHLSKERLNGELTRTTHQWQMFAALLREGSWVEATIDTALTPARPDVRRMLVPVGPVIVFGASNFPFAFSTAGGDTASALASGATVVVKGHPAHAQTSLLMFSALQRAITAAGMPRHTVQHVTGVGNGPGKALVMHPLATGVGFTGSFSGGKALLEYAHQRESPIPVFAEMSSVNPVVFYPDALAKNKEGLAAQYASSITLGVGQFCTNPGILLGLKSNAFSDFLALLGKEIAKVQPQQMLHAGICASYRQSLHTMLHLPGLQIVAQAATEASDGQAMPLLAAVSATDFLGNQHFTEEVFGPYSLAVICNDKAQLMQALQSVKGQLTSTIIATEKDVADYAGVIEVQQALAGRLLLNGAPTGVEVCAAMVHGGPYPATTDARFTSVGTAAIKRWVRPLCLQNFSNAMLPAELKNENPLGIMRLVNNAYTREATG